MHCIFIVAFFFEFYLLFKVANSAYSSHMIMFGRLFLRAAFSLVSVIAECDRSAQNYLQNSVAPRVTSDQLSTHLSSFPPKHTVA